MSKKNRMHVAISRREAGLGWTYFIFELLLLPVLLRLICSILPFSVSSATLNFIYFFLNFSFVVSIFHNFLGKSLSMAGKKFWEFLQAVVLGFVAYWVLTTGLSSLISLLYPGFSNVNDQSIAALAGANYVLMVIGTVVLVPTAEEVWFRGLIFRGLYGRSRTGAYIFSTLAFCAIHVVNFIGNYDPVQLVLCFLQYVPAGLCLAWSYEKSGSIFAPILIHTAVNAIGIYALR